MESHRKSKLHQANVTTSSSQGKQTYIQLDRANFKEKVVSSFLAADVPLHKLNHPTLQFLFVAMGKPLPSKTATGARIAQIASQKEENLRELLQKKVVLNVNEAEVDKQKYINVPVGSLDTTNTTSLIESLPLESSIAMLIAVLFYVLWMTNCDNLGPKQKLLHCFSQMLLGACLWLAKHSRNYTLL